MKYLKAIVVLTIIISYLSPVFSQVKPQPTIIIVHGTWEGGWGWKKVDSLLTVMGYTVYRPTLTGIGERFHLSSPDIGLNTHIDDVANMIVFEELSDIILVGHSYGGMVISGVSDKMPERIKKMIYVDAVYPEDNESVYSALGADNLSWAKVENGYLIPSWVDESKAFPKDVPQPLKTWTDKISLKNPDRGLIPSVFIFTVNKGTNPENDLFYSQAERARNKGLSVIQLEADHTPHRSALDDLVRIIKKITK